MPYRILATVFALSFSGITVEAAPVPAPVQALLQQIKGEWVVMEENSLSTRLSLKADGSGELVNRLGSSPITWRLDGGSIRASLLTPLSSLGFEYDLEGEYPILTTLQTITLDFKKLEGLGTIIWTMTSQSQTTYPSHPEKAAKELLTVSENTRLVAARQFKNFAPRAGQTLALTLPDYFLNPDEVYSQQSPSILARLDAANVMTLIRGKDAMGVGSLYWTLDGGSLRVSDGKGFTVRYKLFKGDGVSGQLLADVEKGGKRFIADETVIHSNEALRATGFTLDSPLFQGCWSAFEPKTVYCFPSDRHFSYTFNDPEFGTYTGYGLWRLQNGRVTVDRYRIPEGRLLEEKDELLACERELADSSVEDKTCELHQTRSYELLNQDENRIGVYRDLTSDSYTGHFSHILKREP